MLSSSVGNAFPQIDGVNDGGDGVHLDSKVWNEARATDTTRHTPDWSVCDGIGGVRSVALDYFIRSQVNGNDTAPEIHGRGKRGDDDPKGTGWYEIDLNWS